MVQFIKQNCWDMKRQMSKTVMDGPGSWSSDVTSLLHHDITSRFSPEERTHVAVPSHALFLETPRPERRRNGTWEAASDPSITRVEPGGSPALPLGMWLSGSILVPTLCMSMGACHLPRLVFQSSVFQCLSSIAPLHRTHLLPDVTHKDLEGWTQTPLRLQY